jgi:uncharacterized LabA/DUF88 family protein
MPIFNAHPRDRVTVFMDGNNLYATLRALDLKINYKRFIALLREETRLVRVNYFTTVRPPADEQIDPARAQSDSQLRRVLDMMSFNGYQVEMREMREYGDDFGNVRFKGTVIPDMIVSMIDAADANTDHIVLISGDGDLTAAVEACKRRDVRVTVVSSEHADVISENLRRSCDQYIDIEDLPEDVILDSSQPFPND